MAETLQTKQLQYRPLTIRAGHNGRPGTQGEPNSYFNSLLSGNICAAIYEKPLTIEEISRKLGVAAAYIESEMEKFLYSDLIKKMPGGKYQSAFYIETLDILKAETPLFIAAAEELAERFHSSFAARLPELRAIAFHGSALPDSYLTWTFLPFMIWQQIVRSKSDDYLASIEADERKDGGKYTCAASIIYSEEEYASLPDREITRKHATNGIKTRGNNGYQGLQMESWWSGLKWRDFETTDVLDMVRVVELIESQVPHTEFDKMVIARLAAKGFVLVQDARLECLIPFFKKEEFTRFQCIMDEIHQEAHARDRIEQFINEVTALREKLSPSSIPRKEIRNVAFHRSICLIFAVMEALERGGRLPLPTDNEKERLMTFLWEE